MAARRLSPWPSVERIERGRDDVAVCREVAEAARAFAALTDVWLTFLPKRAAVESARSTVAGLQRLLTELATLQANGEGPPDGG